MNKLKYIIIFLLLIGCENSNNNQEIANTNIPSTSINNIIGEDLSSEKALFEAINNIPNISKVNASWLESEWVTYDATDRISNEKCTFSPDENYNCETIYSSSKTSSSGKWVIYKKDSNGRLILFLTINNKFTIYAIEREGENSFRLIPQFNNILLRSQQYTRLDSDEDVLYPGMFFLGVFEHTSYLNNDTFKFKYTFTKDLNVLRTVKNDDGSYSTSDKGKWAINDNSTVLTLSFGNDTKSYTVGSSSINSIVLKENGKEVLLHKTYEPSLKNIDNLVGEYQSPREDNYISIKKSSNKYFVDLVLNYSTSDRYYDIEATKIEKDVLSFIIPHRENDYNIHEGKRVTIKIGHNRLYFLEYPLYASISNYEKVSKYPIAKNPILLGSWKSTIYSASNYMISKYFLENGLYLNFNDRGLHHGKYTYLDDVLTVKEVCKEPEVFNLSAKGKYLKLNTINYTPNSGLRDWGKEGSRIGEIYAKNSLDLYQKQNTPELIPHPKYKGTYLFAKKTSFSALNPSFHFNPDGTGSIISIASGTYVDSFSGYWRDNYQSGQALGLKYFIFLENGKEYISYYYDGAFSSYNENHYSDAEGWTFNRIEGNIKDVKIVELYHRRTAVCYQSGSAIYDGSKGGTIMPLTK